MAKSTLDPWPSTVDPATGGTIEFVIANPTTFIKSENGWYYDWLEERNDNLWNTVKTIYDPCPPGYKVSDSDIWRLAGLKSDNSNNSAYDAILHGSNFGSSGPGEMKLTKEAICWYPANGCRLGSTDKLVGTGTYSGWTNKVWNDIYTKSYAVLFKSNEIKTGKDEVRSNALSVRCQKE